VNICSKVVLLVDDSPTVRRMLDWSLKSLGVKTVHAGDGLEALELLRTRDVDLAIVDLNMPRMDGIELIRSLRGIQKLKSLPIILLTTEGREEDRELAYDAGANLFMTKPSTPTLLRLNASAFLGIPDPAQPEVGKANP
jgi:two-component system chemotaxis response regulator CheY